MILRNKIPNIARPTRGAGRRGSALLIVLGFLSFLMVSAVSFSICMRVERQAAANYKHASNARHLLNTALVRAMDEIDAELRLEKDSAGFAGMQKFPTNWMGRVLCSAHADGSQNDNNASVLSWDALAYIPASLVNDVRRFSRPNPDDEDQSGVFGDDTALDSSEREVLAYRGVENFRGAKWRPIRRPVAFLEADNNESIKPTIGRYAYVCVNVSDMPDINNIMVSTESEGAVSNRIFIGSMYSNRGKARQFDLDKREKFGHFDTMADFYACMSANNDAVFANGSTGAPFLDWLWGGSSKSHPDEAFGYQSTISDATRASFFMTDNIVKEEPRVEGSSTSSLVDGAGKLKIWAGATPRLKNESYPVRQQIELDDAFYNALKRAQANDLPNVNDTRMKREFGAMIADYLDDDNYPRSFRAPPMEKVPSISRIYLKAPDQWKVKVEGEQKQIGTTDKYERKWKYTVSFDGTDDAILNVDALYPFYDEAGISSPAVKAAVSIESGFDVAVGASVSLPNRTVGASFPNTPNREHKYIRGKSSAAKLSSGENTFRPEFDANDFKVEFEVELQGQFSYNQAWPEPDEVKVRWLLDAFLHGSEGYAKQRVDEMYDAAPVFNDSILDWIDIVENDVNFPVFEFSPQGGKISFTGVQPSSTMPDGSPKYELPITWQFQSFECPDPSYNWRLKNWIAYQNESDRFNRNDLLGVDGRDGDFYRIVNDCGANIFSVGELGFFPRFFSGNSSPGGEISETCAGSLNDCANLNSFYRTIRLYDQGTKLADSVFRNISVKVGSGSEVLGGARINPLSDQPQVLQMAISHIPSSFVWRSMVEDSPSKAETVQGEMAYLFRLEGSEVKYVSKKLAYEGGAIESVLGVTRSDFEELANGWINSMQIAKRAKLNSSYRVEQVLGAGVKESGAGHTMLSSLRYNLYDVYGSKDVFKWYTASDGNGPQLKSIFDKTLSREVPECYRKLLFAQSLDNFSDRQQLFLIFLSAETLIQTAGESSRVGTKSLAGGKAIALVWRDPYPVGYKKSNGSYTTDPKLYQGSPEGSGVDLSKRVSPWRQYHRNQSSDNISSTSGSYKSEFSDSDNERRDGNVSRSKGFHEMRVLYFRQFTD